jgi:hypothetical protein
MEATFLLKNLQVFSSRETVSALNLFSKLTSPERVPLWCWRPNFIPSLFPAIDEQESLFHSQDSELDINRKTRNETISREIPLFKEPGSLLILVFDRF